MSLHKTLLICLILGVSVNQAQSRKPYEGLRITTAKGGTLQPWIIGLAAVVGFLFIIFITLIVKRLFFKKEREEDGGFYENSAVEIKEVGNAGGFIQTNL